MKKPLKEILGSLVTAASDRFRLLLWMGSSMLLLGLFVKVTWELHEDPVLDGLDQRILVFISQYRLASLNVWAVDMTALGSPIVLTVAVLLGLVVLALKGDRRGFGFLAVGAAGAGIGTAVLKNIFSRPRPTIVPRLVEVSGFSYPSGHSFASASIYLLLMFLAWRHFPSVQARAILSGCAILVVAGIAFSRLYLGVHYPSDVLSGVLLGGAWACFLVAAFTQKQPL